MKIYKFVLAVDSLVPKKAANGGSISILLLHYQLNTRVLLRFFQISRICKHNTYANSYNRFNCTMLSPYFKNN
jgi:hypothetical protein